MGHQGPGRGGQEQYLALQAKLMNDDAHQVEEVHQVGPVAGGQQHQQIDQDHGPQHAVEIAVEIAVVHGVGHELGLGPQAYAGVERQHRL